MSKAKEIWQIIKRKDWKDGDEVHAVKFDGGIMISNKLMETIGPKLDELPTSLSTYVSDMYGLKIRSTPYLPYIYREVKKTDSVKDSVSHPPQGEHSTSQKASN